MMRLDPVRCPSCAARVALDGTAEPSCHHCGTPVELSPDYARELREFWKLPEDFTF